jgi:type IV pilus assembly protein PilO
MTATDDFAPIDGAEEFEEGPSYPSAFGLELTPKVQGGAIAIAGLVGAVVLFMQLVSPVAETRSTLRTTVSDKEAQLEAQRNSLQNQEAIQAELDNVIQQRVGIYSLLGSPESLDTLLLDINQQIKASNAGLNQLLSGRLQSSVQTLRLLGVTDPVVRAFYTAELQQFNPGGASGIVQDGTYGETLNGKLERQVVNVTFTSLFDQGQSILRNIERLEPLVVISGFNQTWSIDSGGIPGEALNRVVRPISTSFRLEVLVPVGDPTQIPAPPPPPAEGEGEGGAPAEGEAPAE